MFVACLLHRQKTSEKAGVENYIFMQFCPLLYARHEHYLTYLMKERM